MSSPHTFLFQQDNAKPHQPMKVICMLRDYGIKVLDDYPAIPDFNPIEHVWSWIVQYIKQLMPTNYTLS